LPLVTGIILCPIAGLGSVPYSKTLDLPDPTTCPPWARSPHRLGTVDGLANDVGVTCVLGRLRNDVKQGASG